MLYTEQSMILNPYTRCISEEKCIAGRRHLTCRHELAEDDQSFCTRCESNVCRRFAFLHRAQCETALMPSAGLSVLIVACIYAFIFLPSANSWRAHKRHFTSSLLHVWPLLVLFWIHRSFRIVKSCHIATLHVITSCFLVRLEVFGLCYIHISFEPHQSLFGSGPRPIFCGLGLLVWCASGFGLQHSHLLKWTALTGQSHHSSF